MSCARSSSQAVSAGSAELRRGADERLNHARSAAAVVLLSGGLDSATALAEAKAAGFELYALTVRYGQRHAVEIEAARRVARALGVARHVELEIDLRGFGGSALTAGPDGPQGPQPRRR